MDCSLPGSSVHRIFQARVLEWGAIAFSVLPLIYVKYEMIYTESRKMVLKNLFTGQQWRNWRRQWRPTPVLLPGKSHGWRSLVGCSPWGRLSRTRLRGFTFTFHFHALEKEMATHSSVLAWRIPGTAEPGRLPTRLKRLSSSSTCMNQIFIHR